MHKLSRRGVLCLLGAGALLSAGCMTKPMLPPNADGTYCFAVGKWYHRTLTCTTSPIPSEQVEAAAKRFEAGRKAGRLHGRPGRYSTGLSLDFGLG